MRAVLQWAAGPRRAHRWAAAMAYNPDTLSFTVPDVDMIYVAGLPPGITEEAMAAHFGTIGVLKQDKKKGKPKIWLYRDKATGALKARESARPAGSQSRSSRPVAWGSACARSPFAFAALGCTGLVFIAWGATVAWLSAHGVPRHGRRTVTAHAGCDRLGPASNHYARQWQLPLARGPSCVLRAGAGADSAPACGTGL